MKAIVNKKIQVLDKGFVELINVSGDELLIVNAARNSYDTESGELTKQDIGLIDYLLRHKHTSPFEMADVTFCMRLPIFVARQIVRHRTASLNEWSGRYIVMPDETYIPDEARLTKQSLDNKQGSSEESINNPESVRECMQREAFNSFETYKSYLVTGLSKEVARINLPLSTYTQWYWKMDLHNLLHFLRLRLDPHAQYEVREYARVVLEIIEPLFPNVINSWKNHVLESVTFSREEFSLLKQLCFSSLKTENLILSSPSCTKEFHIKLGLS